MKKLLLLLPVALGLFFLWPASYTDEEKINHTLTQAITGLANQDLPTVMESLCESYKDKDGLNKNGIRGILFQQFQRNQSIVVRLKERNLTLKDTRATIQTQADILEGSLFAPSSDTVSFDVMIDFNKEKDQWCILGHERKTLD